MLCNKRKRRHLVVLGVMVATALFSPTASAQEDIDAYVEGELSIGRCASKGDLDFGLFLDASSYSDGFFEGLIEPWNDILARNQCQATDVSNLIKQRDKIRTLIRDSFLTCNTQKLPALEEAYWKLNAEIYYVRHVVDGSVVQGIPANLLGERMLEDPDSLFYPREKLYNGMLERYVKKGGMTQEDFDPFFDGLEKKYEDRKTNYVVCENDSWDRVVEKWDEFISSVGGIAPAWKDAERGIGGRAEKLAETATSTSLTEYLSGIVNVNLNNLPFKAGFEEIVSDIGEYLPNVEVPTQETVLTALVVADVKYNTDTMRAELTAYFDALYKNTSDSSVELLVNGLDELNQTLVDSFPKLDMILECTETMNNRQCPNKF